ncbi:MAG: alpha/beta hydrolase [Bdellovibrionales bacterium]|nr:alpha/beta hydrolase [Bdellovibrionales bacterium]
MHRRTFLLSAMATQAAGPRAITYKKVGNLDIQLDLYHPGRPNAPAIFWIHGGALIMGSRTGIRKWQLDRYLAAGYAVAAIDYRLAPETKLPDILRDVEDAWTFVHRQSSTLNINPKRIAVIGQSAGGYLTLTTGFRCKPKPACLVPFYGYGDIAADWYAKPDPFYLKQPHVSEQDARAAVGAQPLTGVTGPNNRGRFYLWTRQQGRWNQEVSTLDPITQHKLFKPYSPAWNVTKSYPPTLLLHGDADTDVPYSQSVQMAAALKHAGVEHELITIPNGPHGFDAREDAPHVQAAFAKVLDFLSKYLT